MEAQAVHEERTEKLEQNVIDLVREVRTLRDEVKKNNEDTQRVVHPTIFQRAQNSLAGAARRYAIRTAVGVSLVAAGNVAVNMGGTRATFGHVLRTAGNALTPSPIQAAITGVGGAAFDAVMGTSQGLVQEPVAVEMGHPALQPMTPAPSPGFSLRMSTIVSGAAAAGGAAASSFVTSATERVRHVVTNPSLIIAGAGATYQTLWQLGPYGGLRNRN